MFGSSGRSSGECESQALYEKTASLVLVSTWSIGAKIISHCLSLCIPDDGCYYTKFNEMTGLCEMVDHLTLTSATNAGSTEVLANVITRKLVTCTMYGVTYAKNLNTTCEQRRLF